MGKSNFKEWWLQLVDERTEKPIDDDSGVFNVLTENDPAEITLYSDGQGTAGSNPGTFSDGVARFWTADTVTAIDLTVLTANGHAKFMESASVSDHHIPINPDKMENTLIVPYLVVGASEAVVDTGFDILDNMLMKDCWVHITTVGTGASLKIGSSTTNGGFASGVSVATTGWPTTLLDEAIVSGSSLIGTFFAPGTGTYVRQLHKRANATSGANIVYFNVTSSSTAGAGYIYFNYYRLPA